MDTMYGQWRKQLDEFDAIIDTIPALEESVHVWGVFAPAVPALYSAVIYELDSYKVFAATLREWIAAHEKEPGDPVEFGKHLRDTIFAARRLKGVIDAYNREKAVVDEAFPEVAGMALKDANVSGPGAAHATKRGAEDRTDEDASRARNANGQERTKAALTDAKPS
jgi:hypothetical protein